MESVANDADYIRLNERDNVVIALRDLEAGATLHSESTELVGSVGRGHKIATRPIDEGDFVYRYGQIIGQAKSACPRVRTSEGWKKATLIKEQFQC